MISAADIAAWSDRALRPLPDQIDIEVMRSRIVATLFVAKIPGIRVGLEKMVSMHPDHDGTGGDNSVESHDVGGFAR